LERRLESIGEGAVLLLGIEGDAEDHGTGGLELGGSVTEALDLDPSPGRVGLDKPPQHDAAASEGGERHRPAGVVPQGEVGGGRPLELDPEDLRRGAGRLKRKVRRYGPKAVAVLGVSVYRTAFRRLGGTVGLQSQRLAGAACGSFPTRAAAPRPTAAAVDRMVPRAAPVACGLPLKATDVVQHIAGMRLDVLDDVDLPDETLGVDQERGAARRAGATFVGPADDPEGLTDHLRGVGEETERCLPLLGERGVVIEGVEGDADDLRSGLLELGGSITEPLDLQASAGSVRLDEPPQDHPPATEVRQGSLGSSVVRQAEIRRPRAFRKHRSSLAVLCAP
jgi:hypothetical protein